MGKDAEIWERFKSGDKSAMSYIYFQHFQSMFQYGIKFKDEPEFIKDCIQDVFYKLIQARTKLSPTSNIKFYLFKALKNAIIKELGKSARIKETQVKFEASFSMEDEIWEKENATTKEKVLVKALNSLSNRQREIIYLRYECGMEYNQICNLMNLKKDSARKLVFRAIKLLKDVIEGELKIPILFYLRFYNKHAF